MHLSHMGSNNIDKSLLDCHLQCQYIFLIYLLLTRDITQYSLTLPLTQKYLLNSSVVADLLYNLTCVGL